MADGKVQFMMGMGKADINNGGIVWIRTTTTLPVKKWHHIVVERVGNTALNFKIYFDGQLQPIEVVEGAGTLNAGDVCYSTTENNNWMIGNGSFSGNGVYPFIGMIKNVRLYKKALAYNVVKDNYNCTTLPSDITSMVLWAKMDEGSGAMLDYSNYQNQSTYVTVGTATKTSWSGGGGPAVNPTCLPTGVLLCNATQPVPSLYLCGKSEPVFPPVDPNKIDNCSDSTFFIVSTATELYNAYIDSVKNSFDTAYRNKCLQAYKYETFTVTHQVNEYHYTLYYYDQAGNLVKTVPPAGVRANRDNVWLEQVRVERNKGAAGQRIVPNHALAAQYRYNTLNQVVAQSTPDAGESKFWYDRLGRLALSQNAKQKALTSKLYSYTKYDVLGRIGEVGEITGADTMSVTTSRRQDYLDQWLNNAATSKTQITQTSYDKANWALQPGLNAQNLRNRVAGTFYFNTAGDLPAAYQSATFYSYDIHGNVDTLLQDYKGLTVINTANRIKKMVYRYDLISGKVNHVAYQPGQRDAFYHRYSYDAENRITNAETSRDSLYWEKEAYYEYYKHGPLARTTLGHNQVQGIDYAYTLQGWLKGVNTTGIRSDNNSYDMGRDGLSASNIARDAFGFGLYYYPTTSDGARDYKPIGNINPFASWGDNSVQVKPLYNGNISATSIHIPSLGDPLLYLYSYDQLNRLTGMNVLNKPPDYMVMQHGNSWMYPAIIKDFRESISYDANGNILAYNRNGNTMAGKPLGMDSLTYYYFPGTNKLDYIKDTVNRDNYKEDIDNQYPYNYSYDAIGNLVKDNAEGISNIDWTVYGKIKKITKTDGSYIQYHYDPSGNRINKSVTSYGTTRQTFYVRDAQGNVMSVYQDKIDTLNAGKLSQTEVDIYGSSRLGMMRTTTNMEDAGTAVTASLPLLKTIGYDTSFIRGSKQYELSNHLGNVLATVSDKKVGIRSATDTATIDHYDPDVITATDYYPFGMIMPGRSKYPSEITEARQVNTCTSCGMLQQLMSDYFSTQYQSAGTEAGMVSFIQSRLAADSLSYTAAEIQNALNTCGNSWKKNIGYHTEIGPFLRYEAATQVRFRKENFSIEAWIYPEVQNNNIQTIVMNHNFIGAMMGGHRLYLQNGLVYLQMGDFSGSMADSGCAQIRTVNTITTNQWHHVVAVRNGNIATNFKIYVDGVLQPTEVADYPAMRKGDIYNEYGSRYVVGNGSGSGPYTNNFVGFIKNLRVYKRPVTAAEALANYDSCTNNPTDTTGLVLWSKIDEGTGTTVTDYSNYHTNGLLDHVGFAAGAGFAGGVGRAVSPRCTTNDTLVVLCKTRTVTTKKVGGYRYGFNGKENDNEVKGEGNQQDYGMRIYDPRVGRFLSIDPITKDYPELTPYQFASNRPIEGIDLDGLEFISKVAEDAYHHRDPFLSSLAPAPQVTHATPVPIPKPSHSDNLKAKPNPAKLPQRHPERHIATPDLFGNGIIGPESVVRENLSIQKNNYYSAVGENIASSPFGAGGYFINGDRGASVGAAVGQVMFSFGGVPGQGFLSKTPITPKVETGMASNAKLQDMQSQFENLAFTKLLPKYQQLDPNLKAGYTGSFNTGVVGNPNKATFGQSVDLKNFDIDFWIESDILYKQFGSNLRADPEFRKILSQTPGFEGLKENKSGFSVKFKPSSKDGK